MEKKEFVEELIKQHTSKGRKVGEKTYLGIEKLIKKIEKKEYTHLHYSNFKDFNEYENARKKHNNIQNNKKKQIRKENEGFDRLLGHAKSYAHKKISQKSAFLGEKMGEF